MSSYYFHENFSLTRALTGMTNYWYQESLKYPTNWNSFLLGRVCSRVVNLLILPSAFIDSVAHVAMGIFTFTIGAPLGILYNISNWHLNKEGNCRFSFSGGIINLLNAKKHFPCAYLGVILGLLNPEAAANFF